MQTLSAAVNWSSIKYRMVWFSQVHKLERLRRYATTLCYANMQLADTGVTCAVYNEALTVAS